MGAWWWPYNTHTHTHILCTQGSTFIFCYFVPNAAWTHTYMHTMNLGVVGCYFFIRFFWPKTNPFYLQPNWFLLYAHETHFVIPLKSCSTLRKTGRHIDRRITDKLQLFQITYFPFSLTISHYCIFSINTKITKPIIKIMRLQCVWITLMIVQMLCTLYIHCSFGGDKVGNGNAVNHLYKGKCMTVVLKCGCWASFIGLFFKFWMENAELFFLYCMYTVVWFARITCVVHLMCSCLRFAKYRKLWVIQYMNACVVRVYTHAYILVSLKLMRAWYTHTRVNNICWFFTTLIRWFIQLCIMPMQFRSIPALTILYVLKSGFAARFSRSDINLLYFFAVRSFYSLPMSFAARE